MTPILMQPDGCEHWKGRPAYITFHEYGRQVHRTYADAESWRARRLALGDG